MNWKKIFGWCGAAMTALFLCPILQADSGHLVVDTNIPIPSPVAYSSTFSIRADGINWASAQLVLTSATIANQTFNDGQAGTGTLTVVSATALSSATATDAITVSSVAWAAQYAAISGGGPNMGSFNCVAGQNVTPANVTVASTTACAYASCIAANSVLLATCAVNSTVGVIYTTAPYGLQYNNYQISTSSNPALQLTNLTSSSAVTGVGYGFLSGGQNNANFCINGTCLVANKDWYPKATAAATADSIYAAINTGFTIVVATDTGSSAVIYTTATTVGPGTNYALTSSTNALGITVLLSSSPTTGAEIGTMAGGSNSAITYQGQNIVIPSHKFSTGLGVYVSTGSNVALQYSTATTGGTFTNLAWGTTVYIIATDANDVSVALTSTGAIAGLAVTWVSSGTKATADTFTFNVPAIAGTPTATWMASNDNVHWVQYTTTPFNISIPSVSYGTYFSSGSVNNMDFGHYNYSYLGLSVVAPTAGAVNLSAHVIGNAP